MTDSTMNNQWLDVYRDVCSSGRVAAPHNQKLRDLDHHTIEVDMNYPVLTVGGRNLNYRFMAAEALWILNGSYNLNEISPYNSLIAEFSDDGVVLSGAYGPRIVSQTDYVIDKLLEDRDTRQATLTIWTPNPTATLDYPCTVAMDFKIREHKLNCHVFMRSSDVWLGLPYDVFTFTCVTLMIMSRYNEQRQGAGITRDAVSPGTLFVTAASSHVYEQHWDKAITPPMQASQPLPPWMQREGYMRAALSVLRDSKPGNTYRWWEKAQQV